MFHYRGLKDYVLNRPFRGLLARCDHVIAHNPQAAGRLRELLGVDPMVVYDPVPQYRGELRPYAGLKPGGYLLLPVSWEPDEPVSVFVEGYYRSVLPRSGIKLVVTGDYRRRMREYKRAVRAARDAGMLVFTGYVDYDRYLWLVKNSLAVSALTTWEYTVLSVIWEAVAYDRPLAYSDLPALRDLVGSDGYPYDPGDPESIAAALDRLWEDSAGGRLELVGQRLAGRLRRLSAESVERLRSACLGGV